MWNTIECAVIGRGHIKSNTPLQDKIYSYSSEAISIIALADGAGSASHSHIGAEIVTKEISDLLQRKFDELYFENSVEKVKSTIMDHLLTPLKLQSEKMNVNLKMLASTVLCVAIKANKMICIHIGDGEIGAIKNGDLTVVSSPANGEYINSTYFVTSTTAFDRMRIYKGEKNGYTSFFLMSDGTSESLYQRKKRMFSPVIKKILLQSKFISKENMDSMLTHSFETVIREKTTDDCSFIGMTYTGGRNGYFSLTDDEKKYILERNKNTKYEKIMTELDKPLTISQIARKIHIKPTYCKKALDKLVSVGIIEILAGKYQPIMK